MENLFLTATLEAGDYVGFTFFIGSMAMLAATVFFFLEMKSVSGKWRTSRALRQVSAAFLASHLELVRVARLLMCVSGSGRSDRNALRCSGGQLGSADGFV